jgi:thiol-disulfide isomerase/thioredoxin
MKSPFNMKPNMTLSREDKMVVAALTILIVGIAAVHFYRRNREYFEDGAKAKVDMYYMNGCPHCDSMKPEWAKFEAAAKAEGIQTSSTEANDIDPKLIEKYNLTGFPTVLITSPSGKVETFSGERTASGLMAAAKTAV